MSGQAGMLRAGCRWYGFKVLIAGMMLLLAGSIGCTPDVKELRQVGIEQYRSRRHIESMATLRHVLQMSHSDAQANYYMGLNYRAMAHRKFRDGDVAAAARELDTALLYFTQAVKSWPNYMAAVDAKNEALEARGKYEEALRVTQGVAVNNRGIAEHYIVLGNEYRERGDYDNALKAYRQALSSSPNSSKAYREMGVLYKRAGDRAMAADAFRRAYEINRYEPGVAEELAALEGASDSSSTAQLESPDE